MRRGLAIALAPACRLADAGAQTPHFEVVSRFRRGRVTWTNTTLNGLVAAAYQRFTWDSREIVDGPEWFNEARFDIVALAPGGLPRADADGFPSQLAVMIRAMLEERFRVAVRRETRERPIYNLVAARPDGGWGRS